MEAVHQYTHLCKGKMRPTTREGHAEHHQCGKTKSVHVGSVSKDFSPLLRFGFLLSSNGFLHLGEFEENQRVGRITVGVVVDQKLESLFMFALADHESRSLRHELDRDEKIQCGDDLKNVRQSLRVSAALRLYKRTDPLPRSRHVTAAKVDPGRNDSAKDPVRVLSMSEEQHVWISTYPGVRDGCSSSRVSDLLNDYKRGHQEGSESESNEDTTTDEHYDENSPVSHRQSAYKHSRFCREDLRDNQ